MKYVIIGKNMEVTPNLDEAVRDKLGKLDKFFAPDTTAHVTLSVDKDRHKIEVTIPVKGSIIRSEQVSNDMYVSIDLVEEVIERQIKKYKGKLIRRHQGGSSFKKEFLDRPEPAEDTPGEVGTTGTDAAPETGTTMTHPEWLGAARKVAEMLQGCQLQVTATKPVTIRGMELLLKGRLDALRGGSIYDIKFSKNYTRGKYQDSTQHPMYFRLVDGAMYFTYVISNGTEVWTEQYGFDEAENLNLIIEYFLDWLEEHRLMETYKNCWQVAPA